jgi:hypothetical protein
MVDRQQAAGGLGQSDQLVAMSQLQGHRLFQQHVLSGLQCRLGRRVMESIGDDDINHVHIVAPDQFAIILHDRRPGVRLPRRLATLFRLHGHRRQPRSLRVLNRPRVMSAEKTITDQAKTNFVRHGKRGIGSALDLGL